MITVALSTTIGAPRGQVWRALTDASQRPVWDERILGEASVAVESIPTRRGRHAHRRPSLRQAPPNGKRIHWRYRLGGVPQVMLEEVILAEPETHLVSRVSIGSLGFDQTLTLRSEDDETGPRTRLGMKIAARNSVAVLGEVLPRLDVQKLAIEYVDGTLRQIRKHCENDG